MMSLLLIISLILSATDATFPIDAINDFISLQNRPTNVVSFLSPNTINPLSLAKGLKKTTIIMKTSLQDVKKEDHVLFIANLQDNRTWNILFEAQTDRKIITPTRWLLIMESEPPNNPNMTNVDKSTKLIIEQHLEGIHIGIYTEVYIGIRIFSDCHFYSVYRIHPKSVLNWRLYSSWKKTSGLTLADWSTASLPMFRRDLQGYPVNTSVVVTVNASLDHLEDYQRRDEDTYTKYSFNMIRHIGEFMNGSLVLNFTDTWGYPQPDGSWNGAIREIMEGRAEFCGTPFAPLLARMPIVQYVLPPSSMKALFIFKKPSLAAVTNIFVLPFSRGVWAGLVVLIVLCTISLFISSFVEEYYSDEYKEYETNETTWDRLSDSVLDTLSFVFQQGVVRNAVSISRARHVSLYLPGGRQILLLGLMVFMFLFTSYSANVVALLQSTTNDIKDVKDLYRSPLKLGLQDVVYNQFIFTSDTRPVHSALYRQKLVPQGAKAFINVEEGIRRVRNGMYAFHVQQTAGYDEIQRTFWDEEKCNLGQVVFTSFTAPYLGVGHHSHIKELFKIGAIRVMESGVQSRSTRRVVAARPTCASQTAMFAAVELPHVGPAFRALFAAAALAIVILIVEIIVFSHKRRKAKRRWGLIRSIAINYQNHIK